MSDITATMLQDKLNSIERNAYDGIDFNQEVTAAYVLSDELGERIDQLSAENAKLRALVESYGMIANEAVCDYYDRDEMLADANATASEMGIEVGE